MIKIVDECDSDEKNILTVVELNKVCYKFTLKNINPEQRVWLDEVFVENMKRAYEAGRNDFKNEMKNKALEFKKFFGL